jgi:hypothetical protein
VSKFLTPEQSHEVYELVRDVSELLDQHSMMVADLALLVVRRERECEFVKMHLKNREELVAQDRRGKMRPI